MARNNSDNKQVSDTNKPRKEDIERTSNQGRKESSGGNRETNNRGHQKGVRGTANPG